jgi:hypothetical protein
VVTPTGTHNGFPCRRDGIELVLEEAIFDTVEFAEVGREFTTSEWPTHTRSRTSARCARTLQRVVGL